MLRQMACNGLELTASTWNCHCNSGNETQRKYASKSVNPQNPASSPPSIVRLQDPGCSKSDTPTRKSYIGTPETVNP